MRLWTIAIALFVVLGASSLADAADWTTTLGGSAVCGALRPDGICYVATGGAATSAISVRLCSTWTLVVYGTGVTVTPQSCTDSACGTVEPIFATALTGDAPNNLAGSLIPFELIRLATSDSVTVSLKCGR